MRVRITPSGVVAGLALFVAMSGTAVAATGGAFILGRANSAGATTSLSNPNGTALSLGGGAGRPALAVSNTAKVTRLNADLVDGLDSGAFQRRVAGTCAPGYSVRAINPNGTVVCDDQQASVVEVTNAFTGTRGSAVCPDGYVAVGGGFTQNTAANQQLGIPILSDSFSDQDTGDESYVVELRNTSGTEFAGQWTVSARCVYGGISFASNQAALRAKAAARRG